MKRNREKLDNEEQITKKEKKIYLIRIKEDDMEKHEIKYDHDDTITIEKKSTTKKRQPQTSTEEQ